MYKVVQKLEERGEIQDLKCCSKVTIIVNYRLQSNIGFDSGVMRETYIMNNTTVPLSNKGFMKI